MLQEIHLCTPPISQAVTRTYPTVQSLHHAYKGLTDREERVSMLADVEVRAAIILISIPWILKTSSRLIEPLRHLVVGISTSPCLERSIPYSHLMIPHNTFHNDVDIYVIY